MKKGAVSLLGVGVLALFLSGCATTSKKIFQENADFKMQIQNLEAQLQQKDAEIDSLRKSLSSTTEEKYAAVKLSQAQGKAIVHPKARDIQSALKNAGYDIGVIDGKLGKNTRQAIKDFQKANGLEADGKVGKKTWAALAPYLESAVANK